MSNFSKVYLRGAYGPGNLGDDVLMIIVINILLEVFEPEDITVGVEDASVAKNFFPKVNWVHYKTPRKCDLMVYGGGGQFFSFERNSKDVISDEGIFNKLGNFLKRNRNIRHAMMRILYSRLGAVENLVFAKKVASYCIGLGPFEVKGKGEWRLKAFLEKVDYCSVRDETSAEYYAEFNGDMSKLNIFIDPSFDHLSWYKSDKEITRDRNGYYTYIVRDWPFTEAGEEMISLMLEHAMLMKEKGHKVRIVSFHKNKDQKVLDKAQSMTCLVYDPATISIENFMYNLLSESKYICSARAHGVWLSTILGFPVLAVGLENKLKKVHESLSNCSSYTKADNIEDFSIDFANYTQKFGIHQKNIDEQISTNREQAIKSKNNFLKWIQTDGLI